MERSKHILIGILIGISSALLGQNKAIYQAYIRGDMQQWKQVLEQLETQKHKTQQEELHLLNYQYGYIAWCISQKSNQEAKQYIKRAERIIEKLENKNDTRSIVYAYKAAFVGFEIGLYPYKAPFIGPQSLHYAQKAKALDPTNAFAYIQLGNIAYYTPKMFGGSKVEALKHYQKAMELLEKNPQSTQQNWNYLNVLATNIEAYLGLEEYKKAEALCIKTLKLEPQFEWVAKALYPQTKK